METWAIVTLVLGTSALSSLLTFFITKMQVSHSDGRLEKELERARETDYHQRRREVRSEPLLKLGNELAHMATKQDKLVTASSIYFDLFGSSDREEIKEKGKELRDARNDWNTYLASGILKQILFLQYDEEVVSKVEEILKDYDKAYVFFENYWDRDLDEDLDSDLWKLRETELGEQRKVFERNRNKIIEVQEIINKRLEEL